MSFFKRTLVVCDFEEMPKGTPPFFFFGGGGGPNPRNGAHVFSPKGSLTGEPKEAMSEMSDRFGTPEIRSGSASGRLSPLRRRAQEIRGINPRADWSLPCSSLGGSQPSGSLAF